MFAALAGAATIATFAVTIVMGQEYLPGRIGVASGVTIGLSIGLGGVGAPLLGLLADAARPARRVRGRGGVPAAGAAAGPLAAGAGTEAEPRPTATRTRSAARAANRSPLT